MTAIAILGVMLADMHENTTSTFLIATTERDQLRAEYMARSGINLTRLVVAQRAAINAIIAPLYTMVFQRPPPEIPVWTFANTLLQPFCDYERAREVAANSAVDLSLVEGLGETNATCEIVSFAENSRLSVNKPVQMGDDMARNVLSRQLFGHMGGYISPSPYDPLFEGQDADGQYTSRLDIVSDIIDWWDYDTERTTFDPGAAAVTSSGAEDDIYSSLPDPYKVKNAPFDSIEELRLIRGIGDDFWATFVEPNPDDPRSRLITVYGSGRLNPNEAPPEALLSRVCSIISATSLCSNPEEALKFITLLNTIKSIAPVPFFASPDDFVNFIAGQGRNFDLYPLLVSFLGQGNALLFAPVTLTAQQRTEISGVLVVSARILTIESTGTSGRSSVRVRSVVNFHEIWTPPPPNPGTMPGLGIFYYYRVD